MNLFQRLSKAMSELSYIQKTANVGYGNNSYKAVSHDEVTSKVRQVFITNGIACIPTVIECTSDHYEVNGKSGPQERYETKMRVKVSFHNIDDPKESFESEGYAHAFDNQDKSPGKAYSMAVKYAYLKVLMLESGDEEEQRVEDAKKVKAIEKDNVEMMRSEVKILLKQSNKYKPEFEKIIYDMNLSQLKTKIEDLRRENASIK